MKITRRTSRVREWSFGAALLAVFAIAGCTPGQRASEMTSYSAQGVEIRNSGALHHSAGPNVPCAGGDRADHAADANPAAHGCGGLQRV